ncbi:MAG: caspase family protein [Acidimicrobiia bacterium]
MARGISLHIGLNEVDPDHYRDGNGNPWRGELRACENDARDMERLAEGQGFEVRGPLLTAAAKANDVIGEVKAVAGELEAGDIFFLTYSGHGGQVRNTNPDDDPESDALDETWCLFDRELLDDELFALFSEFKPGVRIVVFSDSCHSGTVTRARPGDALDEFSIPKQLPIEVAEATEEANADLYGSIQRTIPSKRLTSLAATVVLLSGCQDSEFSRDGQQNGAFTGALLRAWQDPAARKSLPALREATAAGIPRNFNQNPNYSIYSFDIGPALTV